MDYVLKCINELKLLLVKIDIFKNIYVGFGVGSSNVEVRYRDVEMVRIFNFDCVNRI